MLKPALSFLSVLLSALQSAPTGRMQSARTSRQVRGLIFPVLHALDVLCTFFACIYLLLFLLYLALSSHYVTYSDNDTGITNPPTRSVYSSTLLPCHTFNQAPFIHYSESRVSLFEKFDQHPNIIRSSRTFNLTVFLHNPESQLTVLNKLHQYPFIVHSSHIFNHYPESQFSLPDKFNPFNPNPCIVPSSVCQCLDSLQSSAFGLGFNFNFCRRHRFARNFRLFTFLRILLLLSGDIESNPGPSTLNFSNFNIRSALTSTAKIDKPSLLQEFIFDNNIEILTLSEIWLA